MHPRKAYLQRLFFSSDALHTTSIKLRFSVYLRSYLIATLSSLQVNDFTHPTRYSRNYLQAEKKKARLLEREIP